MVNILRKLQYLVAIYKRNLENVYIQVQTKL